MVSVSGGLSTEHSGTSTDMGYLTQSWEVKEGFPEEVLFFPVLKSEQELARWRSPRRKDIQDLDNSFCKDQEMSRPRVSVVHSCPCKDGVLGP